MGQIIIDRFNEGMYKIYRLAKEEANYNAKRFLHMLDEHGGLQTAHILLNSPTVSAGYTALWERGKLGLTVEALVYENSEYQTLFSKEQLDVVKKRLKDYGYIK